jgi:glycosyltransferase involved in cell wall biosynthesis
MACGTPVVAAEGSSVTEVVGQAGLLVPQGDSSAFAAALASVLENDAKRAELRERGLERSRQFTWQEAAKRTVDLYQEVIAAADDLPKALERSSRE